MPVNQHERISNLIFVEMCSFQSIVSPVYPQKCKFKKTVCSSFSLVSYRRISNVHFDCMYVQYRHSHFVLLSFEPLQRQRAPGGYHRSSECFTCTFVSNIYIVSRHSITKYMSPIRSLIYLPKYRSILMLMTARGFRVESLF